MANSNFSMIQTGVPRVRAHARVPLFLYHELSIAGISLDEEGS
ncbi:hypothetical protein MHB84_04505 [Paenibacillus sp. FSL F4-0087]